MVDPEREMVSGLKLQTFNVERPRIAVVSHERSGTHFLMNSVATAFGYVPHPFIDFEQQRIMINYHHAEAVAGVFRKLGSYHLANLVKSHHHFAFFADCIDEVLQSFTILYVYRDPREVMRSFHHFIQAWDWSNGPKVETCKAFIRAEPYGHMMRYQMHQNPNLLKRWEAHVEGWLTASEKHPAIIPVPYERLDRDYAGTIDGLGGQLDLAVRSHKRPSREINTISPSATPKETTSADRYDESDLAFFEQQIGGLMRRLGYL